MGAVTVGSTREFAVSAAIVKTSLVVLRLPLVCTSLNSNLVDEADTARSKDHVPSVLTVTSLPSRSVPQRFTTRSVAPFVAVPSNVFVLPGVKDSVVTVAGSSSTLLPGFTESSAVVWL